MPSERNFNRALMNCIQKALEVCGESGKQAVIWHLENRYGIRLAKVGENPDALIDGLTKIFGEGYIQKKLVNEVIDAFALERTVKSFHEAVALAKQRYTVGLSRGEKVRRR